MIDLAPHHLETVLRILSEHVPHCEVRAFGSRATWEAQEHSDLDLAIDCGSQADVTIIGQLKEAFEESNLPIRVDVVDWHAITESFRASIESHSVVVQQARGPTGWCYVTIGDIAKVAGGGTPSTKDPDNFDGDIPWLTPKDLSGPHDRYVGRGARNLSRQGLNGSSAKLLPADSVLLTTRAPIGYVALAKNPISTNQGFRSLITHEDVAPEFLYYWLKLSTTELERHASGTTFRELPGSSLKKIRLHLPPPEEQRAIAEVLGSLDDKIELNRRMSETLDEMAQALFRSWFVDFGPVHAKAKGQSSGLPRNLDVLFPDSFEGSELGDIPVGWQATTLGRISHKPQYGYTQSARDEDVGPRFLRITDINKKPWVDWGSVPHCEIGEGDYEKYRLQKGDVLIARMADPGHGCMIEEEPNAVFASYLIRFRPVDVRYGRLLQYWLRSDGYWQLVGGRGAGTTRRTLNAKVLGEFPLVIPPIPVLDSFREQVTNLRTRIVANVKEARVLRSLRDTLLPRLLSGELRVLATEQPQAPAPA